MTLYVGFVFYLTVCLIYMVANAPPKLTDYIYHKVLNSPFRNQYVRLTLWIQDYRTF